MSDIRISAAFDGGNIEVVEDHGGGRFDLRIRPDNASDFFQWFYFRVTGAKGAIHGNGTTRVRLIGQPAAATILCRFPSGKTLPVKVNRWVFTRLHRIQC